MKEKSSVSLLWGGGAAALMLAPFLGKPLHMDAPLIVWAARQIRQDPLNFYGVAVNWFGTVEGLDRILRMPPLFAAMISPFVHAERILPLVPLVCAVLAACGVGVLARLWGAPPVLAGVVAVATPAFVVCGSLVMPDMALLAFWTWAVVFQVKGHDRPAWWAAAALCALGAVLTKYSGVTLVPLLALYSVWRARRLSAGVWALLLPLGGWRSINFTRDGFTVKVSLPKPPALRLVILPTLSVGLHEKL
ncbi:MAG: glycosyltransferase family 39 protein [Elusimicrobia bacterium]|nr:glycosyltransferase family 39 protein [Elusimicrobiota bacterium]